MAQAHRADQEFRAALHANEHHNFPPTFTLFPREKLKHLMECDLRGTFTHQDTRELFRDLCSAAVVGLLNRRNVGTLVVPKFAREQWSQMLCDFVEYGVFLLRANLGQEDWLESLYKVLSTLSDVLNPCYPCYAVYGYTDNLPNPESEVWRIPPK